MKHSSIYLSKIIIALILMPHFMCAQYKKSAKIPVTSISKEAIAHYNNGMKLENLREFDSAAISYNKAIAIDTSFALAYLRKALLIGDFGIQVKIIKKALKKMHNVSDGEKLWIKGSYYFSVGSNESMDYKLFDSLVKKYPNDENANYLFGLISYSHGNKKYQQAKTHLEKAATLKPNFTNAYNDLAYVFLEQKDYNNAKKAAKKFIEIASNKPKPHKLYAEILMREGSYEESINAYKKILNINANYPWAIMGIASNLNFLNRHNEARVILRKLEDLDLTDYEFRHKIRSKVVSFLDQGKVDSAIYELEKQKQLGVKKETKHEPFFHAFYGYLRITKLLFERGDWKKGLEEYKSWQNYISNSSMNQQLVERVNVLESYYKAYSNFLQGDYNSAKLNLKKYLEKIHIENDNYIILKSKILKAQNKTQKAKQLIEKSNLDNSYNQFEYAETLKELGEIQKAKNWYSKVSNSNNFNIIDLALVRSKAIQQLNSIK